MSKRRAGGFEYTYSNRDFSNLARETFEDDASSSKSISQGLNAETEGSDALPPPTSVAAVRAAMSNTRLAAYLADFDAEATDESRVVCSIPTSIVDDQARAQLLAAGVEQEDSELQHRNELEHIDFLKRNRIVELEAKRRERREAQARDLRNIELQRQQTSELVDTYYEQAERELDIHLTSRQGEISQAIGEIRHFRRGDYDPDKPDWNEIEQQVHISVDKIEGVKDKIPKGEYLVLVSKWDKMAGEPLRWSTRNVTDRPGPPCPLHGDFKDMAVKTRCEVCKGWAGATMWTQHDGNPKSYTMKFESNVYTFFQPQTRIKPYNNLMFELVRLPEKNRRRMHFETEDVLRPKVVGWGVIPIVDSKFSVVNGKFRFPLLRGPYKPKFGHYQTVQETLNEDLENWLGNIYVEIYPMPREHFGQDEFKLQADFAAKLLRLESYPSARDPMGWPFDKRKRGNSLEQMSGGAGAGGGQEVTVGGMAVKLDEDFDFGDDEMPYQRPKKIEEMETRALTLWNIVRVAILDRQRRRRLEEQQEQREAVKRIEEEERHRYAIHPRGSTSLLSEWRIQVEYCIRAIKDDLSLRDPLSFKFYLVVVSLFVSLYVQLYIHGVFLYLALVALNIPVDSVTPRWYGLEVEYLHRQTTQLQEIMIAFFSMMSLYLVLLTLIFAGWMLRWAAGHIPEHLSKFVFLGSFAAMLVPLLEPLLDLGIGTRRSDLFRLADYFGDHDYGQQFTAITFILLYVLMFAGCGVSTFLYTMGLHLNGILQDAYWRIVQVDEKTCHVPDDLEVSLDELRYILRKSEQWRGMNGERRKVSVYKLVTTDQHDPQYERVDLHIQVCELNCGSVERWVARQEYKVYREFFVKQEGFIVEVKEGGEPHGVSFMMNKLAKRFKMSGFTAGDKGASEALVALFGGGGGGGGARSMSLGALDSPSKKKVKF